MKYIVLFFLLLTFSFGHKINLFITEEEGSLEIYSYFANGNPCNSCQVLIKSGGENVVDDKLNTEGKYFYTPKTKEIEIIVDATGGHRVSEIVQIENIKKENLKNHLEEEQSQEFKKILLGFVLIFGIFSLLKFVVRK
ncbi:MAG: hypothetical protein OIF32_07100 [Campylobacterales bacterium]|nr:hypothetical protein [Campylobacterales bacterium]